MIGGGDLIGSRAMESSAIAADNTTRSSPARQNVGLVNMAANVQCSTHLRKLRRGRRRSPTLNQNLKILSDLVFVLIHVHMSAVASREGGFIVRRFLF